MRNIKKSPARKVSCRGEFILDVLGNPHHGLDAEGLAPIITTGTGGIPLKYIDAILGGAAIIGFADLVVGEGAGETGAQAGIGIQLIIALQIFYTNGIGIGGGRRFGGKVGVPGAPYLFLKSDPVHELPMLIVA